MPTLPLVIRSDMNSDYAGNDALLESCRLLSGDKNLHVDDASMLIVKALWEREKELMLII